MERKRGIDVLEMRRLFENEIQRTFSIEHFFGRDCLTVFIFNAHIRKDCRSREQSRGQFRSGQSIFNTRRRYHKIGIFNQGRDRRIVMAIDDIDAILLQNRRKITRGHRICTLAPCCRTSRRLRRTHRIFGLRRTRRIFEIRETFQVRHNRNCTTATHPLECNSRTDLATAKNNQLFAFETGAGRILRIAKTELFERPEIAVPRA